MKANKKKFTLMVITIGIALLFASVGFADVPPPPVNQDIGFYDGAFAGLDEAGCRACHDPGLPDQHHVLYGEPIPPGSVVPIPDADGDGVDDTHYGCLNCHGVIGTDPIEFGLERDCLVCHTSTPHHATPDAVAGDCVACHGDIVDNMSDGHRIPTYDPSLVTPQPKAYICDTTPDSCYEDADCPPGESCVVTDPPAEGGCNFCHDGDTSADPDILSNPATHHGTGLTECTWCHDMGSPAELKIRTCEGCHGLDSLHNIAADTPNVNNPGVLVVGGEDPGYSHVGNDSDCWGCHGFSMASAPGTGPAIPSISSSDVSTMTAGTNTAVTLTGVAFTNVTGSTKYTSNVSLTAADGSSVTLIPDSITQGELTVTIPGSIATGNYALQVVKDENTASNPVSLTIKPEVVITDVICNEGVITITGSGFGDAPPEGAEEYINVEVDGVPIEIISWTDTEVQASVSSCSGTVTVNALFGSETYEDGDCDVCYSDCNQDGAVNLSDLLVMKDEFSRSDCDTNSCQADCNVDGSVDIIDLIILKIEFSKDNCCTE